MAVPDCDEASQPPFGHHFHQAIPKMNIPVQDLARHHKKPLDPRLFRDIICTAFGCTQVRFNNMGIFEFFTFLFNIKKRPVRRVVDGLLYDTNEAELIASHRAMRSSHSDMVLEDIYKTSRDRWFLMCQADARHAIRVDNTDHVFAQPLTPDEAYNWLVEFNEVVALERFFPERIKKA